MRSPKELEIRMVRVSDSGLTSTKSENQAESHLFRMRRLQLLRVTGFMCSAPCVQHVQIHLRGLES